MPIQSYRYLKIPVRQVFRFYQNQINQFLSYSFLFFLIREAKLLSLESQMQENFLTR
jgi:hypothetical protein